MEVKTVYFDNPGPENTDEALAVARQRADELGIRTVLVASTIGNTAAKAVNVFQGFRVVVISHAAGSRGPNTQEFTDENRAIVENKGGIILTCTHAFAGVSRALRRKSETAAIGDIIANTLRVLGQGMKVVCEIAIMAADSGLVRTDEDVIAIAGSGRGADTVVTLTPVYSQDFFDLKVKEILCKPHF